MQKKIFAAFAVGAAIAFFIGNRIGSLMGAKADPLTGLNYALDSLGASFASQPFHIDGSVNALMAGVVCAVAVLAVWGTFFATPRSMRQGEEAGSARWGTKKEGLRFRNDEDPDNNILLTEHYALARKRSGFNLELDRNRNVELIGGPGSGKTRYYVKPNLMQLNADYFVTDPKCTLVPEMGYLFEEAGYDILSLNSVDFSSSLYCNPLWYVHSDADIWSFCNCLIKNTDPGDAGSKGDPFWENSERLLYASLIALLRDWFPKKDYTLVSLKFLLSLANASEDDESARSPLDLLFDQLKTGKRYITEAERDAAGYDEFNRGIRAEDPKAQLADSLFVHNRTGKRPADYGGISPEEDLALSFYESFRKAAGKTLKSILISCEVRLAPIGLDQMSKILSGAPDAEGNPTGRCELELDKLGDADSKRVIFCGMSDTDSTFDWLFAVIMWQTMNVLCDKALLEYGGSLPRQVDFIFDEFANIGTVPDFDKTITVARSRNIGISIILQSVSQLANNYSEDASKVIQDGCDTLLFLGGKSNDTNKTISDAIGQQTLTQRTFNQTKGQSSSYTKNFQTQGRALIDPAEVAKLSREKAILLISGTDPLMDRKYRLEGHPRYSQIDPGHAGADHEEPFDYRAYMARLRAKRAEEGKEKAA